MRRLTVLLLLVFLAVQAVAQETTNEESVFSGYILSDLALDRFELTQGGLFGPAQITTAAGETIGVFGLVLDIRVDDPAEPAQGMFSTSVGVFNLSINESSVIVHNAFLELSSFIYPGDPLMHDEEDIGDFFDYGIRYKVVANLENLSESTEVLVNLSIDGVVVGSGSIQRVLSEAEEDPVWLPVPLNFTILTEGGAPFPVGSLVFKQYFDNGWSSGYSLINSGAIDIKEVWVKNGSPSILTFELPNGAVLFNQTVTADSDPVIATLVIPGSDNNFADADVDGIPDVVDKCPASSSTVVDALGCGCADIQCEDGEVCRLDWGDQAYCITSDFICSNGAFDPEEEGVDCGGICDAQCSVSCPQQSKTIRPAQFLIGGRPLSTRASLLSSHTEFVDVTFNITVLANNTPVPRGVVYGIENSSYGMYRWELIIENGTVDEVEPIIKNSRLHLESFKGSVISEYFDINESTTVTLEVSIAEDEIGNKDSDSDGILDYLDFCPDSNSSAVDISGCSCEDISWCTDNGGLCSISDSGYTLCEYPCYNGVQDDGEEGVDCGGSCSQSCEEVCPKPTTDTCSETKPFYYTPQGTLTLDCKKCGCPDNFVCSESGSCNALVKTEGVRCKTERYHISYAPIDCKTLGPTWEREDIASRVNVNVKEPKLLPIATAGLGFLAGPAGPLIGLFGGFGGSKMVAKKAQSAMKNKINAITVCIDTRDMGCVPAGLGCTSDDALAPKLPKIQQLVESEANQQIKDAIPGIGKTLGLKASVSVNIANIQTGIKYACSDAVIDAQDTCTPLIKNGPSDKKADVLIIGAEFFSKSDLEAKVLEVLDYNSDNTNTEAEGLFSIEPFQSNKHRFNFWVLPAGNSIGYENNDLMASSGNIPVEKDVLAQALKCGQVKPEYTIVLSKHTFRSFCNFGPTGRPCAIALGSEPFPGRLFAHEFGHGFGLLADEYHNYIESIASPQKLEAAEPLFHTGPNCQPDEAAAEVAWGSITGGAIGYFKGCGGDCGAECSNFVRPTYNSIMRYEDKSPSTVEQCDAGTLTGPSCLGPPFSPWYEVNAREIVNQMQNYILEQEGDIIDPYQGVPVPPENGTPLPSNVTNGTIPDNGTGVSLPPTSPVAHNGILELNEFLRDEWDVLGDYDTTVLSESEITTIDGGSSYEEVFFFRAFGNIGVNSSLRVLYGESDNDETGFFLYNPDTQGGSMFEYEMVFDEDLTLTIAEDGSIASFPSEPFTLLKMPVIIKSGSLRDGVLNLTLEPQGSGVPSLITLTDNILDADFSFGGVSVGGELIEDSSLMFDVQVLEGNKLEFNRIRYRLEADSLIGDLYVPVGEGIREQLDEPEGLLSPFWDIKFVSYSEVQGANIEVTALP